MRWLPLFFGATGIVAIFSACDSRLLGVVRDEEDAGVDARAEAAASAPVTEAGVLDVESPIVDGGAPDTSVVPEPDSGACPPNPRRTFPGPAVTSTALGSGACSGTSAAAALKAVHELRPDLGYFIYPEGPSLPIGDGFFASAYALPSGGFAIVLRGGHGDCQAGCIHKEYWYFETAPTAVGGCVTKEVGHYIPNYSDVDRCANPIGDPMWGWGTPAIPAEYRCGYDAGPDSGADAGRDLSGTHVVCAKGSTTSLACTDGTTVPATSTVRMISVTVAHDPSDLSKGTLTLQGTGIAKLDGVTLDATFNDGTAYVKVQKFGPSSCDDTTSYDVRVTIEGRDELGSVELIETRTTSCPSDGGNITYCKGGGSFRLYEAQLPDGGWRE